MELDRMDFYWFKIFEGSFLEGQYSLVVTDSAFRKHQLLWHGRILLNQIESISDSLKLLLLEVLVLLGIIS